MIFIVFAIMTGARLVNRNVHFRSYHAIVGFERPCEGQGVPQNWATYLPIIPDQRKFVWPQKALPKMLTVAENRAKIHPKFKLFLCVYAYI